MNRHILIPLLICVILSARAAFAAGGESSLESAQAAHSARDFDRAAALLEPLVAATPPDPAACRLLSDVRLAQKRTKDAIVAAELAIEHEPGNPDNHTQLGAALGQRINEVPFIQQPMIAGKLRRAFARAVELNPKHIGGLIGLSRYHANAPAIAGGSIEKAREYANRLADIHPYLGALEHGFIAEKAEDYGAMLAAYEQAARLNPGSASAGLGLGRALEKLGRRDDARAAYAATATQHPAYAEARDALARMDAAATP